MYYIMSDLHGLYDRYQKALQAISLQEEDRLFILGDVIDRGPDGIEILEDIMKRKNVELFLGNHEFMMLAAQTRSSQKQVWYDYRNGGQVTAHAFSQKDPEEREDILAYLKNETQVVRHLDFGDKEIILSHTGFFHDKEDRRTSECYSFYALQEIVWGMWDHRLDLIPKQKKAPKETIFISGHIITRRLHNKDTIFVQKYPNGYTWIDIDCGCAMGKGAGALAVLPVTEKGEILDPLYFTD